MLKKTILATLIGSTLLASSASFADNRHWGHDSRHYQYVRPAHRVVVVQRQVVVHRPAPVYYQRADAGAGLAILAGAVIGGAIAYHIANGN